MIIVFGSINVDMIFPVDHFPAPGETIASKPHEISYGGKGANAGLRERTARLENRLSGGRNCWAL